MDKVDGAGVVRAGDGLVVYLLNETLLLQALDCLREGVASDMELLDKPAPVWTDDARSHIHAAAQRGQDLLVEVRRMHPRPPPRIARRPVRALDFRVHSVFVRYAYAWHFKVWIWPIRDHDK